MTRVAQIGAAETNPAYNRAFVKRHVPSEDLELGGDEPLPTEAMALKKELQMSAAAHCIADQCAMWRWGGRGLHAAVRTHGYCGLAPMHGATKAQS